MRQIGLDLQVHLATITDRVSIRVIRLAPNQVLLEITFNPFGTSHPSLATTLQPPVILVIQKA